MRYTPHNDFHMRINNFPHILFEVNSDPGQHDRIRLLLQASCMCRIGNWLRASTSRKLITIMAVYVDQHFKAHQYLLYQPSVQSNKVALNRFTGSLWLMAIFFKVEYVSESFDLKKSETAFEFLFRLYNFVSVAQTDNEGFDEPEQRLEQAKQSVARKKYPTITSKKKKRKLGDREADDSDHNNIDHSSPSASGAQDSFGDPLLQREFRRAGYTLITLPKGFKYISPVSRHSCRCPQIVGLTSGPSKVKPTMRQATSRSGVGVVLKTTTVDSNERRLLQYFTDIKAPSNHTIPLYDVIDLTIGKTIIVLERQFPLDEVIGQYRDDAVSFCLQFIEGVAFLHEHKVAHCDLKPDNIVVDTGRKSKTSPRLFIIDLDMAQDVESEETMTKGWCGTPPYIAPEVGSSRDGPIQRYSPILADRWACGKMIKYFTKYFPTNEGAQKARLLAFARRLVDVNPRARPELTQLQAIHGPTKRKTATNPVEPIPKRPAMNE